MSPPSASVVGGGPAGLHAAEVLATAGVAVTVHERMRAPGRKLLLAGRGGVNLTNAEPLERLLDRYGPARDRLEPAVRAFPPEALRAWAAGLGQETFVGTSGRVFPTALRATGLLRAWLARLDRLGVEVRTGERWTGFDGDGISVVGADGTPRVVGADVTVLAVGGASWPRTGSDGSWVGPLRAAGVAVNPLVPANGGVIVGWSERFRALAEGAPLKNVALEVDGVRVRGEALVTARGLEGGAVYALSNPLRAALERGRGAHLLVDLRPDSTHSAVVARLAATPAKASGANRLRRAGLAPVAARLVREVVGATLPAEPQALAALVKALPVPVTGLESLERAISTAGGIDLDEVDNRWMLRGRPGTFVAGEALDWEAPTGGYLLQACWSTGGAAAQGALDRLADQRTWANTSTT